MESTSGDRLLVAIQQLQAPRELDHETLRPGSVASRSQHVQRIAQRRLRGARIVREPFDREGGMRPKGDRERNPELPTQPLALLVEGPRLIEPALGRTGFGEHASRLRTPSKPARRVAQRLHAPARDDRPWGGSERAEYEEPRALHILFGRILGECGLVGRPLGRFGRGRRPHVAPMLAPHRAPDLHQAVVVACRLQRRADRSELIERGLQLPMLGDRSPAALDQAEHRRSQSEPSRAVPRRMSSQCSACPRSPTSIRAVTKSDAARTPSA